MLLLAPVTVTWVGALPPIVTVTVSIDCLPPAAVITSWPHLAGAVVAGPPYCTCCWIGQFIPAEFSAAGVTWAVMVVSVQPVTGSVCATPSAPIRARVPLEPKP